MFSNDSVVLDKISELLKEKGKRQKHLCEYLGLNPQAFTNWKNGSNDSYMKYLPEISEYFGVTIDYLLGNSDRREHPAIPDDVLDILSSLSEEDMMEVRRYLHTHFGKGKTDASPSDET